MRRKMSKVMINEWKRVSFLEEFHHHHRLRVLIDNATNSAGEKENKSGKKALFAAEDLIFYFASFDRNSLFHRCFNSSVLKKCVCLKLCTTHKQQCEEWGKKGDSFVHANVSNRSPIHPLTVPWDWLVHRLHSAALRRMDGNSKLSLSHSVSIRKRRPRDVTG